MYKLIYNNEQLKRRYKRRTKPFIFKAKKADFTDSKH